MTQKTTLSIALGVIIGLFASYVLYHGGATQTETSITATSTGAVATATSTTKQKKVMTVGGITFETDVDNPAGISLEQVPANQVPKPAPTINASVTFSATANVSADAQKIIKTQIADLVKKLAANPGVLDNWLSLGLYRKMAGEYTKARDAWEYAVKLAPADKQAYNNLGDLYQYYLKDYTKAELNWKRTVELDTKFISGYRALYDLYVQNKQEVKAKAILDAGLVKNPQSIDLLVLTAQYYRDRGDKTQARTYYTKALAAAKLIKENASLLPVIQAEIDKLK